MRSFSILGNTMKLKKNLGFPQRSTDLRRRYHGGVVASGPAEAGALFLAARIAEVSSVVDVNRGGK
jgi:hypothetical protein